MSAAGHFFSQPVSYCHHHRDAILLPHVDRNARHVPDAHDAPVPGGQGAVPRRPADVPHGRLLRDVLRGCPPGRAHPGGAAHGPPEGDGERDAMCGVPHHALEAYLAKLLGAGLKVAICDQVEDPAQAKGLVKREVTRVVTPGTLSDPGLLEGKEENFLAGLVWEREEGAGAFLDLSTGSFFVRRWRSPEEAVEDLALLRPREVLFHRWRGRVSVRDHRVGRARVPVPHTPGRRPAVRSPAGRRAALAPVRCRHPARLRTGRGGGRPSAPRPRPWPMPRKPRRAASRTFAASPCARRGTG